jgi:uncharacterized protein (DUF2062 family)
MPRHLLKRYAPDHHVIRNHKHMRMFGNLLHNPNLWHLNRRSVSGAFAAGLFWAMIPIPMQMLAAAASAILFRVNLPVSVGLVWITNPITMPPIFYFNYMVGSIFFPGCSLHMDEFQMTPEWISHSLGEIWQPLILGSLIVGIVLAAIGYSGMRLFWRLHVIHHYKKRHKGNKPPSAS